jgi:spore maturation protein CgeB
MNRNENASLPYGHNSTARLKILFARTFIPETSTSAHGSLYEKVLRREHDLITYGPDLPRSAYESLNFLPVRGRGGADVFPDDKVHADIPYDKPELDDVLRRLPWVPDLFFWTDNFCWFLMKGLKTLPCPTACFLLDPQYLPELKVEMAKHFDHVFVSQKTEVDRYRQAGAENVYWLPHACDPEIHNKKSHVKRYDIGFVGTLNPKREAMIGKLRTRFDVHYERCFGERMAEVYSESKIIFNVSTVSEINMRIFEAMATGSLLLTDSIPESGLEDLFADKEHLVYYRSDDDMMALAEYYLKHEEERERIAQAGRREVLTKHTYGHRVAEMIAKILAAPNERSGKCGREYDERRGNVDREREKIVRYRDALERGTADAASYLDLGIHLSRTGQVDQAILCYRKALETGYPDARIYNNLGIALRERGETGQAIAAYQTAIDLDPAYADAYFNLGNAFQESGDLEKAVRCYLRTIDLSFDHAAAYHNLATVYLQQGRFDKHMQYFREALRYQT